jgi:hypothetical protein
VTGDLKKWGWLSAGYRRFIGMIVAKKFRFRKNVRKKFQWFWVLAADATLELIIARPVRFLTLETRSHVKTISE